MLYNFLITCTRNLICVPCEIDTVQVNMRLAVVESHCSDYHYIKLRGLIYFGNRPITVKLKSNLRGVYFMKNKEENQNIFNLGMKAKKKFNFKLAAQNFQQAATLGNPKAKFYLAEIYRDGKGVEQNTESALRLLKNVTNSEDIVIGTQAKMNIAKIYSDGIGIEKNPREALKWLKNIAESSDDTTASKANMNIAEMYRDGLGIKQNGNKAIEWFKKVIKSDDKAVASRAKASMAEMYRDGLGIKQNGEEAIAWFKAAIIDNEDFSTASMVNIAEMYRDGIGVEQNGSKALHWFKNAVENDDNNRIYSMINIAKMYRDGIGVEQNEAEAIKWFKKALEEDSYINSRIILDKSGDAESQIQSYYKAMEEIRISKIDWRSFKFRIIM